MSVDKNSQQFLAFGIGKIHRCTVAENLKGTETADPDIGALFLFRREPEHGKLVRHRFLCQWFQQVSAGIQSERVHRIFAVARDDHNIQFRIALPQAFSQIQPVDLSGHLHIQESHIQRGFFRQAQRLLRISRPQMGPVRIQVPENTEHQRHDQFTVVDRKRIHRSTSLLRDQDHSTGPLSVG